MCEYSPEWHNAAAAVDTLPAASASVVVAYAAAAASGGSAAWPDIAKRDDGNKDIFKYLSLLKLLYYFELIHVH